MNWKKFFKPTKGKILLFVILFIMLPAPIFKVPIWGGPEECNGAITCTIGYKTFWFPLGGFLFISSLFGAFPIMSDMTLIDEILRFLYLIVVPYILSCITIFIYKKIKNKKFNKKSKTKK